MHVSLYWPLAGIAHSNTFRVQKLVLVTIAAIRGDLATLDAAVRVEAPVLETMTLVGCLEAHADYVLTYIRTCMLERTNIQHAYIHAHAHAYTHACKHASIRAHMHAYVHAYRHTYMHASMPTCMHTYKHVCIHACMHTCMHPCIHARIHTYIRTCMHTCIDASTCILSDLYACP